MNKISSRSTFPIAGIEASMVFKRSIRPLFFLSKRNIRATRNTRNNDANEPKLNRRPAHDKITRVKSNLFQLSVK